MSSLNSTCAQPEFYDPDLYDIPGEVQTLSRSNLYKRDYQDEDKPQINHYVRNAQIGHGRHGHVWLCYKVNPKLPQDDKRRRIPVAIKEISRQPNLEDKFQQLKQNARRNLPTTGHNPIADKMSATEIRIRKEIAIMKKCRHPHVVRLLEVIDDRMINRIYLVMEYQAGGEVKWRYSDYEPALTVDQTRRIMRDVVLGVEYLHFQGIIHRDIKPANLLWSADRRVVKIADFGTAHFSYAQRLAAAQQYGGEATEDPLFMDDSALSKTAGTPAFIAPELIWSYRSEDDTEDPPPVGKAIDIWTLGVTLYCLLFGGTPFIPPEDAYNTQYAKWQAISRQDFEIYPTMGADKIPTGGRHPADESSEGFVAVHLLDHLLTKDPRDRISLRHVKENPWFLRDLPNPERWLAVTSPAKIEINDDDTSTAISSVRFSWRWGTTISKGLSSLLKGVRLQRSRDAVPEEDDGRGPVRSFTSIRTNRSTPALHSRRDKGKQKEHRAASPSTRSERAFSKKKSSSKPHSKGGSDSSSKLTGPSPTHERSTARRLLTPWKSSKSPSSTISRATASPDNAQGSMSVPPDSPIRRMRTLPGPARQSVVSDTRRPETRPEEDRTHELSAAKRASSWGDQPLVDLTKDSMDDEKPPDQTVLDVGAGGLASGAPSRQQSQPFGIPIDLEATGDSETSYGSGSGVTSWVSHVNEVVHDMVDSDDEDDGPLTFSTPSRRRVGSDASDA